MLPIVLTGAIIQQAVKLHTGEYVRKKTVSCFYASELFMKNWFIKNLGDAMLAYDQQDLIKQLILSAYEDAENPKEMVAFIRHESEGRLHCEVIIYFSPMLASVAKEVNATPCVKPSSDGLSILSGSQDSWLALF